MPEPLTLSIDAMGGDVGIPVTLAGAQIALVRNPDLRFILVGDEKELDTHLIKFPALRQASIVRHAEISVRMDEKPSQALRKGRGKSSMWIALQAVKDGEAQAAISAGNTGALMAMSVFCVKTMPLVARPSIAAIWPTIRGESIVLDVGASIGAKAEELVQMAMMGASMARALFDLDKPSVGLLNIGVEEVKGLEPIKNAAQLLKDAQYPFMDYKGFVEGDDIGKGVVDVIVTEGYTGNIALKAAEGTAKQIGNYLRSAMSQNLLTKLGYLLAKPAFNALKEKMDPRKVNGGVFLGLNGVVIKSHGGTDAEGFASAVDLGADMVRYGLMDKIKASLETTLSSQPTIQVTE